MKFQFDKEAWQQWLAMRSLRESIAIFMVGVLLIYGLWQLLFEHSLHRNRESLQKQRQDLESQLKTQEMNLTAIQKVLTSSSFTRSLHKQRELSLQSQQAGEQLQQFKQTFVPFALLSQVGNAVIAPQPEVVLMSMTRATAVPWMRAKGGAEKLFFSFLNIYKEEMALEFRGTYFNTIAFLSHLEKLPWHLYWDVLDYQVLDYPEAKVVARFYVLSNQKG